MFFKILNGYENIDRNMFFRISVDWISGNTHSHRGQ